MPTKIEAYIYFQELDYSDDYVTYHKGYYHLDETENLCGPFATLEACRLALADYLTALKG